MKIKKPAARFQIGKNGLTKGLIENLKTAFKDRENIKINVLKAAGHTKENARAMGKEIIGSLGEYYTFKTLGFVIFLKKWRKPRKREEDKQKHLKTCKES